MVLKESEMGLRTDSIFLWPLWVRYGRNTGRGCEMRRFKNVKSWRRNG